jgi:hypothetical protein
MTGSVSIGRYRCRLWYQPRRRRNHPLARQLSCRSLMSVIEYRSVQASALTVPRGGGFSVPNHTTCYRVSCYRPGKRRKWRVRRCLPDRSKHRASTRTNVAAYPLLVATGKLVQSQSRVDKNGVRAGSVATSEIPKLQSKVDETVSNAFFRHRTSSRCRKPPPRRHGGPPRFSRDRSR